MGFSRRFSLRTSLDDGTQVRSGWYRAGHNAYIMDSKANGSAG